MCQVIRWHDNDILSEGEKEVVNELGRMLQPQERGWGILLQIFLIHPSPTVVSLANRSSTTVTSTLGEVSHFCQRIN